MIQAETEAIAQGMLQITDEFQKQTGIADEVVDRIIEHSFRKMELVQAPPEYILLLLPDELKNYCFRCPNAPEPKPVERCCLCGEGIYEGDEYLNTTDGCVCKDCLENFSIDQWLELIGESLTTAEREE